ncbi:lysozyme inhibitor LprI family protein [Luteibacter sp. 22Crub2.1]|uniref:lysozyme inhibitor LprI family protein n=1 Tax=Luteibacter sp. 22Crub2.1 TaxID=1283288 RepID=UPI0009CD38C7|nr:lysozyme inhibitor LprI family protein [Luteibacter sp. 22Crub2.1]SKB71481.1 Uncharacterized protein conserved in bacteria [Luteibacter sp. 22Crub2.1]
MDEVARLLTPAPGRARCSFLCVAVAVTATAYAQPSIAEQPKSHLRQAYTDCVGGSAPTTAAVLQCAHVEFAYQDKRLNWNYRALMSRLSSDEKDRLRSEEREWIGRKSTKCVLPDNPGTADQIVAADCEVNETEARATELEQRLRK